MTARIYLWPGALAGAAAGLVMAASMMGYMLARQQSVWTNAHGVFGVVDGWTFLALAGRASPAKASWQERSGL